LIGAVVVTLAGQRLSAYALGVVVSMTVCLLFNVASAARLAGSTATIICLVPHQKSTEWMMASRVILARTWCDLGLACIMSHGCA
jgi:hypothetical protein